MIRCRHDEKEYSRNSASRTRRRSEKVRNRAFLGGAQYLSRAFNLILKPSILLYFYPYFWSRRSVFHALKTFRRQVFDENFLMVIEHRAFPSESTGGVPSCFFTSRGAFSVSRKQSRKSISAMDIRPDLPP
jgi:hypothetical protein